MHKKLFKSLFIIPFIALSLTACSKEVKQQGTVEPASKQQKQEAKKEETTAKVFKENGMTKTPIFTNENLNVTGETGGIKYNYKGIQISEVKLESDEAAMTFDAEKNSTVVAVAFGTEFENTNDKDVSFYPNLAKLITNTKQQVEPNGFLSDEVGGDFLGKVKKEGTVVYILKNIKAKDLKTLEVRIDAPNDATTFESLGNEVKLNFEVK